MRVAVVGLGGVGGYIAANFVRAGIDVVGFARGAHLEAIQEHGLEIVEDELCWSAKIDAREEGELDGYFEGAFDVVLFCVKSYDLDDAYANIRSHVDERTILLSLSNGVDNGERLRKMSQSRVIDACVYVLSHIEAAGKVRKKGKVFAAVFGGEREITEVVASLFKTAELRYKTPEDIQTALWKKYLFISAFATLTSYYDKPISWVCEHHFDEAKTLVEEISDFAAQRGINIADEVQKVLDTAKSLPMDASTSMHRDFTLGKRVELDSLSGYVRMPLMQKLYAALKERV